MEPPSSWWTFFLILATGLGPVLAVQAQKWIERYQEPKKRKEWVFHVLMTNRAARLSPDFVRALNTIDLAFHGGVQKRSKTEQRVIDVWREYLAVLTRGFDDTTTPQAREAILKNIDDLAVDLYQAIANDLGYVFTRETLRSGGYYTQAAAERDNSEAAIRRALVELSEGKRAIPMILVPNAPQQVPQHAQLVPPPAIAP